MASGRSVEHQFYVNKQTDVRMLLELLRPFLRVKGEKAEEALLWMRTHSIRQVRTWHAEEEKQLGEMYCIKGATIRDIACAFGRTQVSVRKEMMRLKLLRNEDVKSGIASFRSRRLGRDANGRFVGRGPVTLPKLFEDWSAHLNNALE